MQTLTSSRLDMLNFVDRGIANIEANTPAIQEQMRAAFPNQSPAEREVLRQQMLSEYNIVHEHENAPGPGLDSDWYTPRQPLMATVQATVNNQLNASQDPTNFGCPATEEYGDLDLRWAECLIDAFKTRCFEHKAPFVEHADLDDFYTLIGDNARIVLVSDWGGNNDAANAIAAQIVAVAPDYVIHLGDIYYAGQDNEVASFLRRWPGPKGRDGTFVPTRNFALNGNHEMYSGARGYFNTLLPAFGQKASYFGIYNTYWQFLAFDSAYVDHRLLPPPAPGHEPLLSQWNWLVDKAKNSPALKTVLLSHHQPFSCIASENASCANMKADFEKFSRTIAPQTVYGWFFGHEHNCTIYSNPPLKECALKARLIGNGCIPHSPPDTGAADADCAAFDRKNRRVRRTGDAMSGFVLLTCNGPQIDIRYLNEDGSRASDGTLNAPVFLDESWL